ncbi:hypothetical protein CsSME_00005605 [Camellia sinensis var. sinensis]
MELVKFEWISRTNRTKKWGMSCDGGGVSGYEMMARWALMTLRAISNRLSMKVISWLLCRKYL